MPSAATIFPHDFLSRHNLIHRLYVAPLRDLTPPALAALTHRIPCALRRTIGQMGLRAIVLFRPLEPSSALRAPSTYRPALDLSERVQSLLIRTACSKRADPGQRPTRPLFSEPPTPSGSPQAPDLSERVQPGPHRFADAKQVDPGRRPARPPFRALDGLPRPCAARARIPRRTEPA